MNNALVSFVRQWMGDYDAKKEKEEDRKYSEAQYEKRQSDMLAKESVDRTRQSLAIEDELLKQEKQKALDSVWMARNAGNLDINNPNSWELFPDMAKDVVRKTAAQNQKIGDVQVVREALRIDPTLTDEQVSILYPQLDTANVLQGTTSLEGIRRGVPKSTVDTTLSSQGAQRSASELTKLQNEAAIPRAGEVVRSGQMAQLLQNKFGGQSPSQALVPRDSTAYTVVNPDTGEVEIVENIYANRLVNDPMAGMIGGNNMLGGIAEQLGMEKRPMKIGVDGKPERVARPATATPSSFTPKFSGNLSQNTGVTNFGKATLDEALDAAGIVVTEDGLQAKPISGTTAFGRKPLFNIGTRDPSAEEAEAMRQRASRIIQFYQGNR